MVGADQKGRIGGDTVKDVNGSTTKSFSICTLTPTVNWNPGGEIALLGTDAVLVPADTENNRRKAVAGYHIPEGMGLQFGTAFKRKFAARSQTFSEFCLILPDNKLETPFPGQSVTKRIHLGELVPGINMQDRKRDAAQECFANQPEQGR